MSQASLRKPRRHPLLEQLMQIGGWLLDGAAQALGFQGPEDHPLPPAVGPQPFSGRVVARSQR